jgi:hypothetical protein
LSTPTTPTQTKRQTPVSMPETPVGTAAGWEAAGRQIAPMLGSYSAAVVTSADEFAAAHVAIGIGRVESEHRRVAIGDLVGEVEPLQALVRSDDPHGISDSFAYGISLNKIARQVDGNGNLFVMPSGTGSVSDSEIFQNVRWQRLANGFREMGALLLLVAPANAPGLRELINQTDGVVLVDSSSLDFAPYLNVLARVPAPVEVAESKSAKQKVPAWRIAIYLIILLAVLGVGAYMWYLKSQTIVKKAAVQRTAPAVKQALVPAAAPPETLAVAPPANPQDSDAAAIFAVELAAWNTPEDAKIKLMQFHDVLPGGTIAPVPIGIGRDLYYKLIAGAFRSKWKAQALLTELRQRPGLMDAPGTVVRTPYALLLDSAAAGQTQALVQQYIGSGQPVYVLEQPDGKLKLYAGAFERPEDSATLMATLRAAKLNPILVYRTGRTP